MYGDSEMAGSYLLKHGGSLFSGVRSLGEVIG